MTSSRSERPEWIKPEDPLFSLQRNQCLNTMIWLIRTLPRSEPRDSAGKAISILEYILSMREEDFWMLIDRCPKCTSRILTNARNQRLQRMASRKANMIAQEDNLEINLLFECCSKNRSGRSVNKKLVSGKSVDILPPKLKGLKKNRSSSQ